MNHAVAAPSASIKGQKTKKRDVARFSKRIQFGHLVTFTHFALLSLVYSYTEVPGQRLLTSKVTGFSVKVPTARGRDASLSAMMFHQFESETIIKDETSTSQNSLL